MTSRNRRLASPQVLDDTQAQTLPPENSLRGKEALTKEIPNG